LTVKITRSRQMNRKKVRVLRLKERRNFIRKILALGFAFPDNFDAPPHISQSPLFLRKAANICFEFVAPEGDLRFWHGGFFAVAVSMPETPVHENNGFIFYQDDIGMSGQLCGVKPITVSKREDDSSDRDFRLRVFRLYPRHEPTSALWIKAICHFRHPVKFRSTNWLRSYRIYFG